MVTVKITEKKTGRSVQLSGRRDRVNWILEGYSRKKFKITVLQGSLHAKRKKNRRRP